ncbi:unnamed protein product [Allacma fusca]|uniref:Glutamate receptor n=1 Tax=Allacma fusca TaxID=39272 RepID=A0A8J2KRU4_9HEXA|nr:unnamed protein product [Allacma fusca]
MVYFLRTVFFIPFLRVTSSDLTIINNPTPGENVLIAKGMEHFGSCSSFNFVGLDFHSESLPQVSINLQENFSPPGNEVRNFFTHEWSPTELTSSLIFGAAKFQENCIVSVFHENTFNSRNVAFLLWHRFLRPHLDTVLVLASAQNLERALLEKFTNLLYIGGMDSDHLNFQRFKPIGARLDSKEFRVVGTRAVHLLNLKADRTAFHLHGGVEYKMLQAIAQVKNFTFTIDYASGGGGTGTKLPNGTWLGVVGDVYHDRADFGIGCGTSKSRQAISDVSTVYEYVRLTFFTRTPFPVNRWEALFWTFDTNVWMGLSIVTISSLFTMFLFLYFDTREFGLTDLGPNVWYASEIILALLLEQSSRIVTRFGVKSRTRFLLLIWTIGSLLIGTAYKSKLVSFLTFPYTENVPETFQELVDAPKYKISFKYYGGVAFTAFKTSQFPVQRKLFKRFNVEKSLQKCIESVALLEKTVCIVYKADAASIIASNYTLAATSKIAFFARAKEFGLIVPLAWAFPKGSLLRAQFSLLIGMVKSAGLYDFWIRQEILRKKMGSANWLHGAGHNVVTQKMEQFYTSLERTVKPLLPQHVGGPFALLISGLVISGCIFALEVFTRVSVCKSQLM